MKINSINSTVNFASSYTSYEVLSGKKNFYELPVADKLDVIYNILYDQKDDFKTLSCNQKRNMDFNKRAFKYVILNEAEQFLPDESAIAKLEHAYDKNKIDIIA